MSTEKKSVFEVLSSINVNDKVEKKNGLTYLSWAWAWSEVKKRYPDASYEVVEYYSKDLEASTPYLFDPKLGYLVQTKVTVGDDTIPMQLFVMDGANKPKKDQPYTYKKPSWQNGKKVYVDATVEAADMFDINTTIMRCLTKNLAMHGLGHYIYAGEDVPEQVADDKATQAAKPTPAAPKVDDSTPDPKSNLVDDNGGLKPSKEFDSGLSKAQEQALEFFSKYEKNKADWVVVQAFAKTKGGAKKIVKDSKDLIETVLDIDKLREVRSAVLEKLK